MLTRTHLHLALCHLWCAGVGLNLWNQQPTTCLQAVLEQAMRQAQAQPLGSIGVQGSSVAAALAQAGTLMAQAERGVQGLSVGGSDGPRPTITATALPISAQETDPLTATRQAAPSIPQELLLARVISRLDECFAVCGRMAFLAECFSFCFSFCFSLPALSFLSVVENRHHSQCCCVLNKWLTSEWPQHSD